MLDAASEKVAELEDKLNEALEQNIDFMKALKIQEKKLVKSLNKIREVKSRLRSKILKGIDKE